MKLTLIGGFILGFIRGLVEAYILWARYPLHRQDGNILLMLLETAALYGLLIGAAGGILYFILFRILNTWKYRYVLPAVYLIVIIGIDVSSNHSSVIQPVIRRSAPDLHSDLDDPDIVLISIDTCRADHLPMYGYAKANTPFLMQLSQKSTLFGEAVSSIPVTTPSHVSMMTGQYPIRHGSRFNAVPVKPSTRLLAEILAENGYITGAFISAFPLVHEVSGLARGFRIYDQLLTPRKFNPLLYQSSIARMIAQSGFLRPSERQGYQVIRPVIQWWKSLTSNIENRSTAWFTWIHFYDPHAPYEPDNVYRRMFTDRDTTIDMSIQRIVAFNSGTEHVTEDIVRQYVAAYDGEIASVDRAIESLLRNLADQDRQRSLILAIVGDHGESLTEHDYYFTHGDNVYDPSLKIPFMLHSSNSLIPPQIQMSQITPTHLAPILLTCAHSSYDEKQMDGEDYSQYVMSKTPFNSNAVFCESGAGVYLQAHQPPVSKIRAKQRAIRTDKEKLVFFPEGKHSYFDLEYDPQEKKSIAESEKKTVRQEELEVVLKRYVEMDQNGINQNSGLSEEEIIRQLHALGYVK